MARGTCCLPCSAVHPGFGVARSQTIGSLPSCRVFVHLSRMLLSPFDSLQRLVPQNCPGHVHAGMDPHDAQGSADQHDPNTAAAGRRHLSAKERKLLKKVCADSVHHWKGLFLHTSQFILFLPARLLVAAFFIQENTDMPSVHLPVAAVTVHGSAVELVGFQERTTQIW